MKMLVKHINEEDLNILDKVIAEQKEAINNNDLFGTLSSIKPFIENY